MRYINTVIRKVELVDEDENLARYDRDSTISRESWEAAKLSCGAVIEACDKLMSGKYRNAFCAVRPPGHHAGVFGKTFKENICD